MIVNGIDTDAMPPLFGNVVQGRVLIVDGDGPAYVAAATAKRLDTALRNFQQNILTQLFLTKAQTARIHFTAKTSKKAGRFNVVAIKPYQGQRKDKAKPSLVEPLREAAADRSNWLEEYECVLHRELEADDGMMHDAYQLGENGLIWSDDKDLRMTPYPYWCREKGVILPSQPFGWLQPKYTPSGTMKLIGQGPLFFWAQMLMGDTADHIQGLLRYRGALCGPARAYEVLHPLEAAGDMNAVANVVLDAYRAIDQNPVAEGYLLWMLRWPGDHVVHYFNSLALSKDNADFVRDCAYNRMWYKQETYIDTF